MKESPFKDINEERIISELQEGNYEVLKEVYAKYTAAFINWGKKIFPKFPQDEILDSFHTTLIVFIQNVQSGKLISLDSSLKTYLFAIGRNQLLKKSQLGLSTFEHNEETDNAYQVEEEEDSWAKERQTIMQTLPHLGDNCQMILQLLMFENKSIEEVKQIMGYKDNQEVSRRKYKCLEQLKRKMKKF